MSRTSSPAFQWYPADWIRKTRGLSPAAKGVWIDLICQMWWEADQCSISGSAQKLARICGCSSEELKIAIDELKNENICNVKGEINGDCNAIVTLVSRRMRKDRDNRRNSAKRVEKHRKEKGEKDDKADDNADCNGDVTPKFDGSSSSSSSSCTKVHSPPKSPKGDRRSGFKGWSVDDFRGQVLEANADGLLLPEEIENFIGYWCEPNGKGRPRFALEKTWDTRRRMQTALRLIFEKDRQKNKGGGQKFEHVVGDGSERRKKMRWEDS